MLLIIFSAVFPLILEIVDFTLGAAKTKGITNDTRIKGDTTYNKTLCHIHKIIRHLLCILMILRKKE